LILREKEDAINGYDFLDRFLEANADAIALLNANVSENPG
jgi:hypothetical protein